MEVRKVFQNDLEQIEDERLKKSMLDGLVFAKNGLIARNAGDAVTYTTSLLLKQGIIPKFTTGGEVRQLATEDFMNTYKERVDILIKKEQKNKLVFVTLDKLIQKWYKCKAN